MCAEPKLQGIQNGSKVEDNDCSCFKTQSAHLIGRLQENSRFKEQERFLARAEQLKTTLKGCIIENVALTV